METEEPKYFNCRVCLKCDLGNDGNGAYIFNKSDDVFIYEKLNTIANVQIKPEDGLPDRICVECLQELDNAIHFKHKCETSNHVLLSAVNTKSEALTEEAMIDDVKLEEDQYSDHEYLDEDEDAHTPPDVHIKHELEDDHQSEEEEKQLNIQRPSRAIDLKLECNDCGGFFKSKCKFKVHWKKEHLRQYLTCNKCKKVCGTFKALHAHERKYSKICTDVQNNFHIEGTGRLRKFFCKHCEYSTSNRNNLKNHIRKHSGERKYKCNLCPLSFTQISGLQSHKEYKHQIYVKEGPCVVCGEYIKGAFRLRRHMKIHKTKTVSCNICHKVYKNKDTLNIHYTSMHMGKTYSCDLCDKKFTCASNVYAHKKNVHIKNANHICPICGYKHYRADTIKRHIAKHNGDNCACIVCGKFFDDDVQFSLHKQRHNERSFECTQCDKTFFGRRCLVKHLRKVHKTKSRHSKEIAY